MSTGEDAVANACEIDLDTPCSNVNQHNLETTLASIEHHLQIALSGKCGLNGETFFVLDVVPGGLENLASRGDSGYSGNGWLQRPANRIWVKKRSLPEKS